jgi:hypothetical protein
VTNLFIDAGRFEKRNADVLIAYKDLISQHPAFKCKHNFALTYLVFPLPNALDGLRLKINADETY